MASSSSSIKPAAASAWKYDVFLNFRGEDTRNNLVDHLYETLHQKGISTFKDDLKLERGQQISPVLLKAIEESRFAIVVFSKNYASSTWCLDELIKILDCMSSRGLSLLPVFYNVDPSDVRKQRASFGEAFARHQENFKEHEEKVLSWRKALFEASNISGWDSHNMPEAKLVRNIVKHILCKLAETDQSALEDVVGLDSRIAEVNSLLGIGSTNRRIVGICGMGGIGKTTIAKAVYDRISNQFDASSYIVNVREASRKHGLESLQEQLLSELLLESDMKIRNVNKGLAMISNRLRNLKVLVVIDDVDHLDQLDSLVGNVGCFGLGSRIIITTRDTHLLTTYEVDHVYKVKELNNEEAIQLFCGKAFRKNKPIYGFESLTNRIVCYAKGVPLALKVLGSFLFGRSIIEWKSALDRLKERPNAEIQDVLKISYDGLEYTEKEIFLDIACFFKGESQDYVTKIMDASGFYPDIGIRVLIEKSLITMLNDKIEMHDLIQEMGWHIVNEESPKEPGRRSRLWSNKDIYHCLRKNRGTEAVEGIILDSQGREEMYLSAKTFSKMNRLRLLRISNVHLQLGLEYLSNELILLDWKGYPLKCMPPSFQPDKLVELKMSHSHVQQLWKGSMCLDKLRYVDLSYSQNITKTPDFTGTKNLEKLVLEGCTNLIEVHHSLGAIRSLISLNLKNCRYLKVLPIRCEMQSLQSLVLTGCSKLTNISEVLGYTRNLIELYLDETCTKELPIGHLNNLVLISLRDCKSIKSLPSSICGLKFLKIVTLSGCSNLDKLPDNLGDMESLEELRADFTAIKQPPSSIIVLKKLKVLSFRGCKGRMSKPWSSVFSSFLMPRKNQDSMGLVLPSLSGLSSLKELDLSDCSLSDRSLPGDLVSLSTLEDLKVSGNSFVSFSANISGLSRLMSLELVDCKELKALPELPSSIVRVNANGCASLERLPNLSTMYKKLQEFTLSNCSRLAKNQPNDDDLPLKLFQSQIQGFSVSRHEEFTIVVPGREVPRCFPYQNDMGNSVRIQLNPDWYINLKGVVVCALFVAKAATHAKAYVDCNWKSNGVTVLSTSRRIAFYSTGAHCFDSDHLYLHYVPFQSIHLDEIDEGLGVQPQLKTWTEFMAYFRSSSPETFVPVNCAAYLFYERDGEDWMDQRRLVIQQSDNEKPNPIEGKQDSTLVLGKRSSSHHDSNSNEVESSGSESYEEKNHPNHKRLKGASTNFLL